MRTPRLKAYEGSRTVKAGVSDPVWRRLARLARAYRDAMARDGWTITEAQAAQEIQLEIVLRGMRDIEEELTADR